MAKADSHPKTGATTRDQILRAALKHFANAGYAASSVQQIVDDAKLSKPALYYHFKDKAGLFQALVHEAHDERYRLLCEAAERGENIREQLENILITLFDYVGKNRELMRISFATMFAAPGEVPESLCYADKCERNFEFVHSLIKNAQKRGELDRHFDSHEMAFGIYGLTNFYLVSHLVERDYQPDRKAAMRIVELFLTGAAAKKKAKGKKS
ncbi:MAG TPA: TetR/AcrR family transcriptional regulator [Verrucomicrobiae bacterium]|nr:TetR/AcrR family transcriptional regulator [Verrucomicrobiae bacterium]